MAELKFRRGEAGGQSGLIAEQRIFETADGRVVGEDDPDAQTLIAGAGGVIDPRTVERLGLSEKGQEKRGQPKEGEPVPSTEPSEEPPAEVVRPLTLTPTPPSEKPREEEPAEEPEAEPKGKK